MVTVMGQCVADKATGSSKDIAQDKMVPQLQETAETKAAPNIGISVVQWAVVEKEVAEINGALWEALHHRLPARLPQKKKQVQLEGTIPRNHRELSPQAQTMRKDDRR